MTIAVDLGCKATTKQTISSNETAQDKLSKAENRQSSIVIQVQYKTNYIKTCSFLHAHFSETMKVHVVENLLRKVHGETLLIIGKTYVFGSQL